MVYSHLIENIANPAFTGIRYKNLSETISADQLDELLNPEIVQFVKYIIQ